MNIIYIIKEEYNNIYGICNNSINNTVFFLGYELRGI